MPAGYSAEILLLSSRSGRMRTTGILILILALVGSAGLWLWGWKLDSSPLELWITDHRLLGAAVYLIVVAASVVLLPLSSLPLLPLAAQLYGVVSTALLSAAGWWIGSLIAFGIARLGRGVLERVASLDAVDRLARRIPGDLTFGAIVMLHMIFPVELVSFTLGLVNEVRFATYAAAALIGILPFAFVWSYAGGALGGGHFAVFAALAVGVMLTVLIMRRLWAARR